MEPALLQLSSGTSVMVPSRTITGEAVQRLRLRVTGVVQGVGFRPFLHTLARQLTLSGLVGNDSAGVFVEIQGPAAALRTFLQRLPTEAPPLARIDEWHVEIIPVCAESLFRIVASEATPGAHTAISPDVATCADCLRELHDPADRRYRYPFVNCTHCGPRFTIIRDLPYDRPQTTMASFPLCADCAREYHDPGDRRFHAQPIACPTCGPALCLLDRHGQVVANGESALGQAQQALAVGQIVAIKGIGGFHLAVDATNDDSVQQLRQRKGRAAKPFAVMMQDLPMVQRHAWVDSSEAALLTSRERPIVLLRRKIEESSLSRWIAPGHDTLGVLLPYSPLHDLLLGETPLVMTSGNRSEEPITRTEEEALQRLAGLADWFLVHNRPIHVVCDDSIVRGFAGREYPLRRSRGFAPLPVPLVQEGPEVLAVGGELKNTFCLTKNRHAFLSQHLGDMENLETLRAFERAYELLQALFRVQPSALVCDQHPGYLSTRWAEEHARQHGLPLIRVQHHQAHLAALLTEHGLALTEPVLGLVFDGTGHGLDGAIWGGEALLTQPGAMQRLAHLRYLPLPGGDASIRRPYRMALAHLWAAGLPWDERLPCVRACPPIEQRLLRRQLETNTGCVPTSSVGRLFDAWASLLGIRHTIDYEGQAAIEMEACADGDPDPRYRFLLHETDPLALDPQPVIAALVQDVLAEIPTARLSARCHHALSDLVLRLAQRCRERHRVETIGLTGGVFQNVCLLRLCMELLEAHGFRVLVHRRVPANDGGLCLGQAALAQQALRL